MNNKKIILLVIAVAIIVLISAVAAYVLISDNTDSPVETVNNTTINTTNTSVTNNTTNEETQKLSKTIKIKEDYNDPTSEEISKDDTLYVYYYSGYNGQESINRGLIIDILNTLNPLEESPQFKISYAVVKLQDSDNNTVTKTYNPNEGRIKVQIPKDLTPISATVYYEKK